MVNGDGEQTRSFQYIDDLIEGMTLVMKSDFKRPINLGNPTEIKIVDLAKLVLKLTNNSISKIMFKTHFPQVSAKIQ